MYKIEYVCSGNLGRSPVAELIGKDHISKLGLSGEYEVVSSGTSVRSPQGHIPFKKMLSLVNSAISRGDVYDSNEALDIDNAKRREDGELLMPFFEKARRRFSDEELEHRLKVIKEFGLDQTQLKKVREQTISCGDRIAVIGMDFASWSSAMFIYRGFGYGPRIEIITNLITPPSGEGIANAYGKGIDFYRETVRKMIDVVPRSIDGILKERRVLVS